MDSGECGEMVETANSRQSETIYLRPDTNDLAGMATSCMEEGDHGTLKEPGEMIDQLRCSTNANFLRSC